jgi:hypothetical protein
MLGRSVKVVAFAFIAVTVLDSCAYFSKSGRQQLAYERYVRKCSKLRDRRAAKMKAPKIPTFEPSEPKQTTQLGGSPESVTPSRESQPATASQTAADAQPSADISP